MTFLLERIVFHCLCEIIIQNWIRFNSSGNFKGSPSYCRASLSEGAKFADSKHFPNLDFATTSHGCSTPKLGRKLLETTLKLKQRLSGQKFGIEIFLCHFPIQK